MSENRTICRAARNFFNALSVNFDKQNGSLTIPSHSQFHEQLTTSH